MKGYFVRPSNITPSVYFNPKKKLLDIRGRSSPENPIAFYAFVNSSVRNYAEEYKSTLTINMAFEYFNTSSSKCIFTMFKNLNAIRQSGNEVTINWFYEIDDHDMLETGEDLSIFFDITFNFVAIPEIISLGSQKQPGKSAA